MAETAPWLVPQTASGGAVAPWLAKEPEVGTGEDTFKGGISGLTQGVIGLPGFGGDLQNLAKAGAEKAGLTAHDPLGWVTHKLEENFPNAMKFMEDSNAKSANAPIKQIHSGDMPVDIKLPSSADIQGKVEEATGPFYQAQTPLGKAAQTAGQVLPALATGGETLPGTIMKSAGAGLMSEGAGEAADALKSHLPVAAQPYAEPVARAVGAGAGLFAPATIRRTLTPRPMDADQAATVASIKAKDPNFPMTAGQMTNSPGLMGMEGNAPKFNNLPAQQEEAFTRGAMKEMGVDGLATPENIAKGQDIGTAIGNIRRGNEINPNEFPQLNKDVAKEVKGFAGKAGVANSKDLMDLQNEIRMGASNNTNVASMPGGRYNFMRQRVQSMIDGAATGDEKTALSNIRQKMDDAFHRSIPSDQSDQLKQLETQYANYNVLKNRSPANTASGADTMTPKDVSAAVAQNFGNAAVNENRGSLAPWARNVSKVTQELPKTSADSVGSPLSRVTGSLLGGLLAGGGAAATGHAALDPAIVGAILGGGHGGLGDMVQILKNAGSRAVATDPAQAYFKNQRFMPGPSTSADPSMIARLLMSPPAKPLVPGDSRK